MAWSIKLENGKTFAMAELNVGQYTVVSELLEAAGWDTLQPTYGPRPLAAWVAVLNATESEDRDVSHHLAEVMQWPMPRLMQCLVIEE